MPENAKGHVGQALSPVVLVQRALAEDIGKGDITSKACVPEDREAKGVFLAKEPLTLAGTNILTEIYGAETRIHHKDGETLEPGTIIATIQAKARKLLECERTALNFLQHLSGIATLAREFTTKVAHTNCCILDTRKTTPG